MQNLVVITIKIDGMTCTGCENRIDNKLSNTKGILSVKTSFSKNEADITYDEDIITLNEIEHVIENLDYKVKNKSQPDILDNDTASVPQKSSKLTQLIGILLITFAVYTVINRLGFGLLNSFPQAQIGMSYGILFVIGLLTSLHCVAMCGGINLSQCIPKSNVTNTANSKYSSIRPSLLYNLGRVISYTVIGGIVGAVGSVLSFSNTAKGLIAVFAGIFMIIMGLNMLNLFPWLHKISLRMPKIFARKIHSQKSSKSPLYVGLLNGLMPCGPLQAMQLYALTTGSALGGALSMFIFSLGTVPLMFGLGALSSILSKKFTDTFTKFSAILILVLGMLMMSNGMYLSGVNMPTFFSNESDSISATYANGVQTVTTELYTNKYQAITVKEDIPVKWIIKAGEENINSCNQTIVIPKYNIEKTLIPGENIIEFTPTDSEEIPYSCWMGMIKSSITVTK